MVHDSWIFLSSSLKLYQTFLHLQYHLKNLLQNSNNISFSSILAANNVRKGRVTGFLLHGEDRKPTGLGWKRTAARKNSFACELLPRNLLHFSVKHIMCLLPQSTKNFLKTSLIGKRRPSLEHHRSPVPTASTVPQHKAAFPWRATWNRAHRQDSEKAIPPGKSKTTITRQVFLVEERVSRWRKPLPRLVLEPKWQGPDRAAPRCGLL